MKINLLNITRCLCTSLAAFAGVLIGGITKASIVCSPALSQAEDEYSRTTPHINVSAEAFERGMQPIHEAYHKCFNEGVRDGALIATSGACLLWLAHLACIKYKNRRNKVHAQQTPGIPHITVEQYLTIERKGIFIETNTQTTTYREKEIRIASITRK